MSLAVFPRSAVAAGTAASRPDESADTFAGSAVAHPSQVGEGRADVRPVSVAGIAARPDDTAEEASIIIEASRGRQSTLTEDTVDGFTGQYGGLRWLSSRAVLP